MNAGPKDNRAPEPRPDVLTCTSEPLRSALEIAGPVTAQLHVSSSQPSTDFSARLCDAGPPSPPPAKKCHFPIFGLPAAQAYSLCGVGGAAKAGSRPQLRSGTFLPLIPDRGIPGNATRVSWLRGQRGPGMHGHASLSAPPAKTAR